MMYYVKVLHGIEEFAYNWADAVAQAKDLCDLYGMRVDVRVVGQDDTCWSCFPQRSLALA
jgi:hypothetical protein